MTEAPEAPEPVRWTDSHCHLDPDPEVAAAEVAAARDAGVERLIDVGTDVTSSRLAVATAAGAGPGVWATAGVHPHEAAGGLDGLDGLLAAPQVVAVGECGLDYHYDHSPRSAQQEVFAAQIALALARDLALVIHSREAWDDTFAILAGVGIPSRTVFHCFTGGPAEARRALDLGAHLSFSGIVTFPNAAPVRDAAALCPLDRLLVETDSPYLAPVPHRGRPNRPANVAVVGRGLAEAKARPVREIAEATWAAASAVFRL